MSERTELTTRPWETAKGVVNREGWKMTARQTRIAPAVDIFEDSVGITLYADLPGVPREKLDVHVQDGNLTIEAESVVPSPAGLRLHHAEIHNPHFSRVFRLSPDFDVSRVDAQLRDGVLTVTIPRREEARPRRIEVSTG